MAIAHVTFTTCYSYEVEIDDALYDNDPDAAEEQAVNEALDLFPCTYYDEVEVEIE